MKKHDFNTPFLTLSSSLMVGSATDPLQTWKGSASLQVQCRFTSTQTIGTIRDGEPRMATSTFTQLLSSSFMLLYVHRDHRDYQGQGADDGHFDSNTASELLSPGQLVRRMHIIMLSSAPSVHRLEQCTLLVFSHSEQQSHKSCSSGKSRVTLSRQLLYGLC